MHQATAPTATLLALVALVAPIACNSMFGIDSLSTEQSANGGAAGVQAAGGGGDGGAVASGGSGGDQCPVDHSCAPVGPGALLVAPNAKIGCSEGTSELIRSRCDGCDCIAPVVIPCSLSYLVASEPSCFVAATGSLAPDQCANHSVTGIAMGNVFVEASAMETGTSSCETILPTVSSTPATLCQYQLGGPCGGGQCVPDEAPCTLVEPEVECTPPFARERGTVHAAGAICSCDCGTEVNCDDATLDVHPFFQNCIGLGPSIAADESCTDTGVATTESVSMDVGAVAVQCLPEAQTATPQRVCCRD